MPLTRSQNHWSNVSIMQFLHMLTGSGTGPILLLLDCALVRTCEEFWTAAEAPVDVRTSSGWLTGPPKKHTTQPRHTYTSTLSEHKTLFSKHHCHVLIVRPTSNPHCVLKLAPKFPKCHVIPLGSHFRMFGTECSKLTLDTAKRHCFIWWPKSRSTVSFCVTGFRLRMASRSKPQISLTPPPATTKQPGDAR